MKNICGIYLIKNIINGKVYVGKSVNISSRFSNHKSHLKRDVCSKDCNRYLFNSVKKHGIENFEFIVHEELEKDEELLKERELYWMDYFNSCNMEFGYNLRRDSSSQMIVHPETIELLKISMLGEGNPNFGNKWTDEQKRHMSDLKKEGFKSGQLKVNIENTYKAIEVRNKRWEENPELKEKMKKKISEKHNLYEYLKIDKNTMGIIEVFQSRLDVLEKNPDYKTSPLLSSCNGWKKSYKGFIWRYRVRETGEIIEPIRKN